MILALGEDRQLLPASTPKERDIGSCPVESRMAICPWFQPVLLSPVGALRIKERGVRAVRALTMA
jgi:hypothetical protein